MLTKSYFGIETIGRHLCVGILSTNYAARRLFFGIISGAEYKDIRFYNWYLWSKAHLWFLRIIGKLKMTPEEQAAKLFYEYKAIIPTGCDVLHFFNTINYSNNTPWVISVESGVPWSLQVTRCVESVTGDLSSISNDKYVECALRYLASSKCLGLLAFKRMFKKNTVEYNKAISSI